jgi:hypothetical protein
MKIITSILVMIIIGHNSYASTIKINSDIFRIDNRLVDFYRIQKLDLEIPRLFNGFIDDGDIYDATYELRLNKLFLVDFKVRSHSKSGWTSVMDQMFPEDSIVEITCYTGIIECWKGEYIGYKRWETHRYIEYTKEGVEMILDVPGELVDAFLHIQVNRFKNGQRYKELNRQWKKDGLSFFERNDIVTTDNIFLYSKKLYESEKLHTITKHSFCR